MDKSDSTRFRALLEEGELTSLAIGLEPFLKEGDLDARYLACSFSIDPNETGEAFDLRRIEELKALASRWHPESLVDLAWAYRHGNDVERDEEKFQNLLTAAALLGDQKAIRILAELLETKLGVTGLEATVGELRARPGLGLATDRDSS